MTADDKSTASPNDRPNRRRSALVALLALAAVSALAFALKPTIGQFHTLLPALRQTNGWYLAAAIAGQALMYVGVAGILRAGLSGAHTDHLAEEMEEDGYSAEPDRSPPLPSVTDPRFVGASAAFLWANRAFPGPAVAGLATLIYVLARRGIAAAAAQAAAATFYLADYASFATLSVGLIVTLALRGRLEGLNTTILGIAMGGILLAMAATIVLLRSPRLVGAVAERTILSAMRLLRRQGGEKLAASTRGIVDGFYARWRRVAAHPTALVRACTWGLFMHGGEIATIYCCLIAFHAGEGFGTSAVATLIIAAGAAYVAGNLAAIVSFLPAGLGAFEVAMGATLHLVGNVPLPQAALATLAYRLLSVWLPLPFILQTARQALRSAARTLRVSHARG